MNIFLINILAVIFCLVVGYIFGSIPTAVWVGKIFFHQDPRKFGSHNAGGTNAGRLWGKKVGFSIIVLDMLKTIAPTWICWALFTFVKFDYSGIDLAISDLEIAALQLEYGIENARGLCATVMQYYTSANNLFAIQWPVYWVVILGVMCGHCWPLFAGFKGGKAASCFMGTTVASTWLFGFLPGFAYFGILKWKKYVSLTAILTALLDIVLSWTWVILVALKVIPHGWEAFPMYGLTLNLNWTYAAVITILGIVMTIRHHENIKRIINGTERKITWMK